MQSSHQVTTLFFDLGGPLVDPVIGPDGSFSGFTVLPDTASGLRRLADAKLRLGIISNTGNIDADLIRASLAENKLLDLFEPTLGLLSGEVHLDKSTPEIFRLATARDRALGTPHLCRYVGDDPAERRTALRAGMRTSRSLEAALATLGPAAPVSVPNLSNLSACIEDARNAG
jgi:FMN phosphatase YigB (HAD superfamily)